MRSSFLGCGHLALLSAQAASASFSYYPTAGDGEPVAADDSQSGRNISDFLTSAGFSDVETNKYCSLHKEENSLGAAIGRKIITAYGKTYTLLAIMPRSAGYKQEWAGDFTIDDESMHSGFHDARDELLRFMKQYISEHSITGNLKVWTAGHSRGGASAYLLAGFLAGGGMEYFGGDVSLKPEDIYCYTFSAPHAIKTGASIAQVLSVAAAGDRSRHVTSNDDAAKYAEEDTPGNAYVSSKTGKVNPSDSRYSGIRNYIYDGDLIQHLPPSSWGLERYGQSISLESLISEETGEIVTRDEMLKELQVLSPYLYDWIMQYEGRDTFRFTFDPNTLSLVEDRKQHAADDLHSFLQERQKGFTLHIKDTASYLAYHRTIEGNFISKQNALRHAGGLYSILEYMPANTVNYGSFAVPVILVYLDYAHTKLGRSESEDVCTAFAGLLSFLTGTDRDLEHGTVDDAVLSLIVWLNGNPVLQETILSAIPDTYSIIVKVLIDTVLGKSTPSLEEGFAELLQVCSDSETGLTSRKSLYNVLSMALLLFSSDLANAFSDGGTKAFTVLTDGILGYLKSTVDSSLTFTEQFFSAAEELSEAGALWTEEESEETESLREPETAEESMEETKPDSEEAKEKADAAEAPKEETAKTELQGNETGQDSIQKEEESKTEALNEEGSEALLLTEETETDETIFRYEPLPMEENADEEKEEPGSLKEEAPQQTDESLTPVNEEEHPEENSEELSAVMEEENPAEREDEQSEANEAESGSKGEEVSEKKETISLSEAADAKLAETLKTIINDDLIDYYRQNYGDATADDFVKHTNGAIRNIHELREILTDFALYTEDTQEFDVQAIVDTVATLVSNISLILLGHYNEGNISWMKAAVKKGYYTDHYIEHDDAIPASCEEKGQIEYWRVHERTGDHYYRDEALAKEVNTVVIPAKGHRWDQGEVVRKPTHTHTGLIVYTCLVCEKTREVILPKITDDDREEEETPKVIPAVISGCPSGTTWNEAARACQPGILDGNGVFHPAKVSVVNTYDQGIGRHLLFLVISLAVSVFAVYRLKQR